MLSKYGNSTRLLKIKNKLKIGCFYKEGREEFSIFVGVFQSIIPLAFVRYEMIIANSALRASLPATMSYPTRTREIIVKYSISYNSLYQALSRSS